MFTHWLLIQSSAEWAPISHTQVNRDLYVLYQNKTPHRGTPCQLWLKALGTVRGMWESMKPWMRAVRLGACFILKNNASCCTKRKRKQACVGQTVHTGLIIYITSLINSLKEKSEEETLRVYLVAVHTSVLLWLICRVWGLQNANTSC